MTTDTDTWEFPHEVTEVDLAFPARAMELMPDEETCRAHLATLDDQGERWLKLQRHWFYDGLSRNAEFHLKPGVDGKKALRHLKVIQGSYAPSHEHKEVGFAYLASRWFDAWKDD